MADVLALGARPLVLLVHLTPGSDFDQTLVNLDSNGDPADWAAGDKLSLKLGDTSWEATMTGSEATWHVDSTDVDALLADAPHRAALSFTNGDVTQLWAVGKVDRG